MRRLIIYASFILFIALILSGCQSSTGYYLGAKADEETTVILTAENGPQLHWQDLYVTLDYSLERQGNQLTVEGIFTFSDYPKVNLAKVQDLKLKLFLLNEDRVVLGYLDIYRTTGRSLDELRPFSQSVEVPPEAVAIAFGYEGKLIRDFGGHETIWKLPKRNF